MKIQNQKIFNRVLTENLPRNANSGLLQNIVELFSGGHPADTPISCNMLTPISNKAENGENGSFAKSMFAKIFAKVNSLSFSIMEVFLGNCNKENFHEKKSR